METRIINLPPWLSVSKDSGEGTSEIRLLVKPNLTFSERSVNLIIEESDNPSLFRKVNVTQKATISTIFIGEIEPTSEPFILNIGRLDVNKLAEALPDRQESETKTISSTSATITLNLRSNDLWTILIEEELLESY